MRSRRGPITRSPARSTSRTAAAWLADGATAPDGDLLGMNFYVEGIIGDIPQ